MKKILLVFGTRPEAVKMCPLVLELQKHPADFDVRVCVSGQHRQMLDDVLRTFALRPDYDLDIMKQEQSLFDITAAVLRGMEQVLAKAQPDLVLVHGDTTTAFAAALACFYKKIPLGHVEAGLRSYDLMAPYPEEFNRRSIDSLSRWLFAPTESCRQNLLAEGCRAEAIAVTGNTGIDALRYTVREDYEHPDLDWAKGSRLLLLTAHRRENLGRPIERIFAAVRQITEEFPDVKVLYPVHRNPALQAAARAAFEGCGQVRVTEAMGVIDFHNFLHRAHLVLTDSGGLQEEAPALHKPVLVLRDVTERPEGVEAGCLALAGTRTEGIVRLCRRLLSGEEDYKKMSNSQSPYGDGSACERIAEFLRKNDL